MVIIVSIHDSVITMYTVTLCKVSGFRFFDIKRVRSRTIWGALHEIMPVAGGG